MSQFLSNFYKTLFAIFTVPFLLLFVSLMLFNNSTDKLELLPQTISAALISILLMLLCIGFKNMKPLLRLLRRRFNLFMALILILVYAIQICSAAFFYTRNGWDVGILLNSAKSGSPYIEYLNRYPNNLLLFFIYKAAVDACKALEIREINFVLSALNAIMMDLSIAAASSAVLKLSGWKTAAASLFIMAAFIGLSPWIIVPYSDTFSMAFTSGAFAFFVYGSQSRRLWQRSLLFSLCGLSSSVGFLLKPLSIALLAACLFTVACWKGKLLKARVQIAVNLTLAFGIGILLFNILLNFQSAVSLEKGREFPLSYWVNTGLSITTNSLGAHGYGIYSEQVSNLNSSLDEAYERDSFNRKMISDRLSNFGVLGYLEFLSNKARWVTSEGNFFWGKEGGFIDFSFRDDGNILTELFYPGGEFYRAYLYISQGIWINVFFLACVYAAHNLRNLKTLSMHGSVSLFSIYFLILGILALEGRSRYLINSLPLFSAAASQGWAICAESTGRLLRKKRRLKISIGNPLQEKAELEAAK
ncbi:MAG: hypothetical protein LBU32_17120 [Clostridiales bacterium]|nr:hypothetical protein [Clostridiales bacterium]